MRRWARYKVSSNHLIKNQDKRLTTPLNVPKPLNNYRQIDIDFLLVMKVCCELTIRLHHRRRLSQTSRSVCASWQWWSKPIWLLWFGRLRVFHSRHSGYGRLSQGKEISLSFTESKQGLLPLDCAWLIRKTSTQDIWGRDLSQYLIQQYMEDWDMEKGISWSIMEKNARRAFCRQTVLDLFARLDKFSSAGGVNRPKFLRPDGFLFWILSIVNRPHHPSY